ncbi:MAG: aldehyde dehydrogenase family protein, partial [Burkholderiales bacterium]|nr:aldehyde dehydrogenase family protein [Burkholderiales bacterium]
MKRNWIGGQWVEGERPSPNINPSDTTDVVGDYAQAGEAHARAAIAAAREAFPKWAAATPQARADALDFIGTEILARKAELGDLLAREEGKTLPEAIGEAGRAGQIFKFFAGEALRVPGERLASVRPGLDVEITREPLGVVAAITPWNFPIAMITRKCAPGWAAGCTGVVRPASQTPFSALELAVLAERAGMPPGVFNVITGKSGELGPELTSNPSVRKLTFTGSTEVGKFFLGYSAQSNMKQVWLECGGKSPNLVFADCDDLEAAADASAFGIWGNQGEVCSANSRLLVERKIKDQFLDMLKSRAGGFQPGDPLDPETAMGSIVEKRQTEKIMGYISKGKKLAKLVEGGKQLKMNGSDNYVTPTIFDEVRNDMVIAREEIFGPVLSVIPFESEEEAVGIANDPIYGLAASIWSNDLKRVHRLADAIQAGTVSVNC